MSVFASESSDTTKVFTKHVLKIVSIFGNKGEYHLSGTIINGKESGWIFNSRYFFSIYHNANKSIDINFNGIKLFNGSVKLGVSTAYGWYSYSSTFNKNDFTKIKVSSINNRTPIYLFGASIQLPIIDYENGAQLLYLQPSYYNTISRSPVDRKYYWRKATEIMISWNYKLSSGHVLGIEIGKTFQSMIYNSKSALEMERNYFNGSIFNTIGVTISAPLFPLDKRESDVHIDLPNGIIAENSVDWRNRDYVPINGEIVKLKELPHANIIFLDKTFGSIPLRVIRPIIDSLVSHRNNAIVQNESYLCVSGGGQYFTPGRLSDSIQMYNTYLAFNDLGPNPLEHINKMLNFVRETNDINDRLKYQMILFLSQSSISFLRSNVYDFSDWLFANGFNSGNTIIFTETLTDIEAKYLSGIKIINVKD